MITTPEPAVHRREGRKAIRSRKEGRGGESANARGGGKRGDG